MRKNSVFIPSIEQIEAELSWIRQKRNYRKALTSTLSILIMIFAVAFLLSTSVIPVYQVTGDSMAPTLSQNDIVIALRNENNDQGDIIALFYNNKVLLKRIIARAGDWVNIDDQGNVYVNDTLLSELYIETKAVGDCNIELPYQVPDGRFFVMGDHRTVSADSRNTAIGCIAKEQIIGKIVFRIWPISLFGQLQ